jgi:hypothetical protein
VESSSETNAKMCDVRILAPLSLISGWLAKLVAGAVALGCYCHLIFFKLMLVWKPPFHNVYEQCHAVRPVYDSRRML